MAPEDGFDRLVQSLHDSAEPFIEITAVLLLQRLRSLALPVAGEKTRHVRQGDDPAERPIYGLHVPSTAIAIIL